MTGADISISLIKVNKCAFNHVLIFFIPETWLRLANSFSEANLSAKRANVENAVSSNFPSNFRT